MSNVKCHSCAGFKDATLLGKQLIAFNCIPKLNYLGYMGKSLS